MDDVLYGTCRQYPDHANRRGLVARLALINRAYSAGLERRVTPPKGQQAINVIAAFIHEHRAEVYAILDEMAGVREPLTVDVTQHIVVQRGRFTDLLLRVTTDGRAPRSFAAKYLHFHNSAVPIY